MQLIFEYPSWFIIFCLLAGAIAAIGLYWNNRHFTEDQGSYKWLQIIMATLRFLGVSLLSFLLLSPFVKSKTVDKVEPKVVFVHDNSESMLLSFDKLDSLAYLGGTNTMLEEISSQYEIDYFTFGSSLKVGDTLNFEEKKTNLSEVLDELQGLYFNRNIGAVILASDGIYNEGMNPVYTDFSFPLYTIAMGDTTAQRDLKVSSVRNNKIAYLDDKVSVRVDVESYSAKGENYKIELFSVLGGTANRISSKSLKITENYQEQFAEFTINANSVGLQKYRAVVTELSDEVSYENNSRDFYIDVIDSRQKILLIANAPHPDIAAIKKVVESNKNYEIAVRMSDNVGVNLDDYNLVIFHQLPSSSNGSTGLIERVNTAKIPVWYIAGSSSGYSTLNQVQSVASVTPNANSTNDAGIAYNPNFNSFGLSENTTLKMKRFPPVTVPFGNYSLGTSSTILLKQRIGAVESDFPLLAFNETFGARNALFIGDGLWRWRMYDYLDNGNHVAFDELIIKTINFLALKADKRKFRVNSSSNAYYEGEMISIEAELYNESYELVNSPEVSLVIKSEDGKEFPFEFNKSNNSYQVKTNSLPIGTYTYLARTSFNGKNYSAEGAFSINALQLEALQTSANHQLLNQLSVKTGGQMYYPDQLDELKSKLLEGNTMQTTLYESFKTRSIINLFWIFLVVMALFSVEWFMRKYLGAY